MSFSIVIMYAVAAVFTLIGAGLLFALLQRGRSESKIYAYRMIGVMALALGIVLAISATAMWRWSVAA